MGWRRQPSRSGSAPRRFAEGLAQPKFKEGEDLLEFTDGLHGIARGRDALGGHLGQPKVNALQHGREVVLADRSSPPIIERPPFCAEKSCRRAVTSSIERKSRQIHKPSTGPASTFRRL